MLKKLLMIVLFSFIFTQDQSITNISVSQRTDGSGIVDISYDLNDITETFPSFDITVQISFDNGVTWQNVSDGQLSGDFGSVIPGSGKSISYFAESGIYFNTVKIKLLGEGHYVTSDLPFATVTIAPEDIITFESEDINYSFEIMQFELTNAQLVTFLEQYSFNNANNYDASTPWSDTGEAEYTCGGSYNNYYDVDDGFENGDDVEGCMNPEALNYNPYATYEADECDCVYSSNLGCADENNPYYIDIENGCDEFDDCSCIELTGHNEYSFDVHPDYVGGTPEALCNWNSLQDIEIYNTSGYGAGIFVNNPNPFNNFLALFDFPGWIELTYNNLYDEDETGIDAFMAFIEEIGDGTNFMNYNLLKLNYCDDPSALNYPIQLLQDIEYIMSIMYLPLDDSCIILEDTDNQCIYECAEEYPWENDVYEDPNSIAISAFQTQDITYQGSAFTIAPGQSDKPVRFDIGDCAHSIVLTLYMDYYGLRIPTGGEWMKAARGDNTRCWPWMESTCGVDGDDFCDDYFQCLTEEEEAECIDVVGECSSECAIYFTYAQDPCWMANDWQECIDDLEDYFWSNEGATCYDIDFDGQNPSCIGAYADYCTGEGNSHITGDDYVYENSGCSVGNCYDAGGNCVYGFDQCTGVTCDSSDHDVDIDLDCSDCNNLYSDDLYEYVHTTPSDTSFIENLYYDRINFDLYEDDAQWDNLSTVGQHPNGISPYGLYDVIGNAPELVTYNNNLYVLGTVHSPAYETVSSFCTNSAFGEDGHQAIPASDEYDGQKYYGVRLIRTISE